MHFNINNENWYRDNGHPPPRYRSKRATYTGKTSLVRALANLLNRHIIEIPLSEMKNEEQFFNAYYETNISVVSQSLDWSDKINF